MKHRYSRRLILTGLALATPAVILGANRWLPQDLPWDLPDSVLNSGEWLSSRMHRLIGRKALAREYTTQDISPVFRTNGATLPKSPQWAAAASEGFETWRLRIGGRVKSPGQFSLADLKSLPLRRQITRHDCVEGWSAICQWGGVPLSSLLNQVGLQEDARYLVFLCADKFGPWQYYESIDMIDAFHPQTILAYDMNQDPLRIKHGAPCRLRVERQLGYKQAKYIMQINAVATLAGIGDGNGGMWEDLAGYAWYAGI